MFRNLRRPLPPPCRPIVPVESLSSCASTVLRPFSKTTKVVAVGGDVERIPVARGVRPEVRQRRLHVDQATGGKRVAGVGDVQLVAASPTGRRRRRRAAKVDPAVRVVLFRPEIDLQLIVRKRLDAAEVAVVVGVGGDRDRAVLDPPGGLRVRLPARQGSAVEQQPPALGGLGRRQRVVRATVAPACIQAANDRRVLAVLRRNDMAGRPF